MIKKNRTYAKLNKVLSSFGIGYNSKVALKRSVGINLRTNEDYNVKSKILNKVHKIVDNKYLIGRKLILNNKENLDFLTKLKTYRGLRNKFGYPARGQRTHTNAKTKKKLQKKSQK